MVPFGFAVPSGAPVGIPLRHLVITGQTQEAGKTTALEALVARSGCRALAFVTKRGEGAFRGARLIRPYFREETDWRYVAAALEASEGQKLKFERPWIMRAVKGATTLAQVQANVQRLGKEAKGMNADMYLVLDAYLQDLVPQISKTRWAKTVELGAGINAMDLRELSESMQQLVIRSAIDWVLANAENTVLLIPEAWKFIPEGRGTPVKLAAEAYIRQAAALGNYLWLDSQDIAGVEKKILKSCPVWILGVQRELNEVKRTLDQVHGAPKPTPREIARLSLGQFYVCHGDVMVKTYAQPTWLTEEVAVRVARGELGAEVANLHPKPHREERTVTEQEARELRAENARLSQQLDELRRELDTLRSAANLPARPAPSAPDPLTSQVIELPAGFRFPSSDGDADFEPFYQVLKRRLLADAPGLLRVLVDHPELEIRVQRQILEVDGTSLRGQIGRLIADGFFSTSRTSADVAAELARRGVDQPRTFNISLGIELKALCGLGFFTKDNKWYNLVPGMQANVVEAA